MTYPYLGNENPQETNMKFRISSPKPNDWEEKWPPYNTLWKNADWNPVFTAHWTQIETTWPALLSRGQISKEIKKYRNKFRGPWLSVGNPTQKLFSCSSRRPKPKLIFLARPPVRTANKSINFTDFVERIATVIVWLTEFYLATGYKMYSVSSQTKYGNFTWNIFHTSVGDTLLFDLNLRIKNSPICTKEFSKCRR